MLSLSNNFYAQLLEEERKLRNIAEGKVRELYALLEELAVLLAAEEVEKIRREKRGYFSELSVSEWRKFFLDVISRDGHGWGAKRNTDIEELERLRREIKRLQEENERLKKAKVEENTVKVTCQAPIHELPVRPPAAYASLFADWRREGAALGILAQTGWSMRLAIAEELGKRFGISARAGSLKRMFVRLKKNGLIDEHQESIAGTKVACVCLTEKAKNIMRECGMEVVESEWERLMRLHEGQKKHAAMVCVFTYHARRYGYTTEVCPDAFESFRPDVRLENGTGSILVEVEDESGEAERRMKKWRNQLEKQGFAAICATTPEIRQRLVAEAKAAGARHGKATDIKTLIADSKDLWCEEW